MPIPLSVRQRMLADQLLQQQAASTNSPILHRGTGYAKLAAGLLGGLMEGGETKHLEDQQRAAAQSLALPLNGAASPAAADASSPQITPSVPPQSPSGPAGDYYSTAQRHESGGRNIGNSAGGAAYGYYQFMPQTWAAVRGSHPELTLPPTVQQASKQQQDAAYRSFTGDNVNALSSAGIPANDKNTFMAAFMGAGGASKFIPAMQQNPNAPAAALFPREAASNPTIFNGPNGPRSLSDVYQLMTKNFGGGNSTGFGSPKSAQADTPAEGASEASAPGLPPGVSFGPSGPTGPAPASPLLGAALDPSAQGASNTAMAVDLMKNPANQMPAPSAPPVQPAGVTMAPTDGDSASSTPPGPLSGNDRLDPDLLMAASKGLINFPSEDEARNAPMPPGASPSGNGPALAAALGAAPPSPTITSDNGGGPVPVDAPIPPVRPANLGAPPPAPVATPAPPAIPPAMSATAPGALPAPMPPPGSPSPQMLAAGLGGPTLTGRVNNSVQTPTQFNVAQGTSPSALAAALSGSPPPPAPMASPTAPQGNSGPLAALGQAAPSLPSAPPPPPMPAPAAAAPAPGSNVSPSGFNPYANVPNSVLAQYNAVVTNPYASPAMVEAAKERIAAYMPRAVPDNSVMYNPSAPSGQQFTTMPVPHKFAQSRVPGMPPIDESTGLPVGGSAAGDGMKTALQYEKDAAAAKTEGTRGAEIANPTAQTYLDAAAKIAERPSYKELSMAAPTWNAVPAMMADNSPAGDKGLIDAFGKILNPGRSVTTGAMQIIMDTQSIPEELKGAISQALMQGGHLGAQARAQMASIMQDKMDQYQKAWQGTPTVNPNSGETMYGGDRGQAIEIAKASKLDPNKAVPPIPDIAKLDLSQINTHKTPDGVQPAPAKVPPAIGTILKGHKFLGGDPASPKSWAPVQ